MKILIIYGPPGVGKLTVAKELAKKTGFKLFHVHLVADLVVSLLPFGSKEFLPLMESIRLALLKAAGKNKKAGGVILTGVYEPKGKVDLSEKFLRKITALAGKQVFFVQLKCSERELFKRIRNQSRRLFKKIHKKETLKFLLKNYSLDAAVKLKESLTIDNTKLSALECAKQIKAFYKL
jgi:shikimate kinase